MKTLLVLTLFVLLLKSGYCQDQVDTHSSDDDTTETVFQDTDNDQQDTEDIQNALNEEKDPAAAPNTSPTDAQTINLRFKQGRGIILTLTPDGGAVNGNGAIYTRWGKTSCPPRNRKLYSGLAAAGWYHQRGNGANYLCMPPDPQYLSSATPPAPSLLYGAEYETGNRVFAGTTHDWNVPCVVCQSPRINKFMVPAKVSCPSGFTREYYGYLMASHSNHYQTINYECVDHTPDKVPGSAANRNGALFYFVMQNECSYGLPCGPYVARRAVTCAVCTK